jgi:hypothetical protein
MCEWLKKIFGCKCSCKHCHCGEENKEASPAGAENAAPVTEATPEAPIEEPKNEAENL